jgi:hypothetical protein
VGAPVFLEPFELDSGGGLIPMRTTRTDLQGRYRFTGLLPGRYRRLSSFDFSQPSGAEMEAAHAITIDLKEAGKTKQDLELVRRTVTSRVNIGPQLVGEIGQAS